MMEQELGWGIHFQKSEFPDFWALGAGISHFGGETCLYINFVFGSISIGKIYKEVKNENSNN